jgi:hypothetical protein
VLKKITIWADATDTKKLAALAKRRKFKMAHLIRIAIAEYLERESK